MSNGQYNAALSLFFLSYAGFEPLTNILLKRLRPSVFIPAIMVLWGIVMTTMGLVHNAAGLMAAGEVDCVVVGADRIAANGDTANKVGTYGVALLAQAHGIPFYVAAPSSTWNSARKIGICSSSGRQEANGLALFSR